MIIKDYFWIGLALVINGASFNLLKRICLMVLLLVVAFIDWKEYRIPNKSIIIGLCIKGLITVLEMVFHSFVLEEFMLEIIAAILLCCISMICRIFVKNSLGAGDIKMFVIMALFLGWEEIWSAVFFSLASFLVIAMVLVVMKKKTTKDKIPLGPAFALGTSLALLFTV